MTEERGYESTQIPPVDYPDERKRFDKWTLEGKPMSAKYIMEMKSRYGIPRYRSVLIYNVLIVRDGLRMESFKVNHMCLEREGRLDYATSNRRYKYKKDGLFYLR